MVECDTLLNVCLMLALCLRVDVGCCAYMYIPVEFVVGECHAQRDTVHVYVPCFAGWQGLHLANWRF